MKKEDKHCPTDMKFSSTKGRCVQNSEAESLTVDSSARNVSAANLRFKKVKKISGTSEGTPDDSRDRSRKAFQDIHLDLVDKADKIQTDQQNINQRVQANQKIEAPTKFKNFSAKHGNRSTNL